MAELLLTIFITTFAIFSIFSVGLCVVGITKRFLKISGCNEQVWVAAPLVGAGAIILVCQNALYLDVRVPFSAAFICLCVFLFAVLAVMFHRSAFNGAPWRVLVTGVVVYALHALGLFASGVSNYYGYGWADMYNYVAQAQFFVDFPFSLSVDSHEYVHVANAFKDDRIGQTVLHAFVSAMTGADAQQTFGATILLSPMLIFFSLNLLGAGLDIPRKYVYPAAIAASASPAIASVHLECFFSQATAMPFIILWPLAVGHLKSSPGIRSIFIAGMLWAVTSAIYTELIPAWTLLAIIVVAMPFWQKGNNLAGTLRSTMGKDSLRFAAVGLCSLCIVVATGLLANIGYLNGAVVAMSRTTKPAVLDGLYPWAFTAEGLARLWTGNQITLSSGWEVYVLAIVSTIVFVAALAYGVALYLKNKSGAPLFSLLIVCIPLAPLLLSVVTTSVYPYQFYKLLLTVWPLIFFLATCAISQKISSILPGRAFGYFQIALICVCFALTARISYASSKVTTTVTSGRGASHLLIDENFKLIRKKLGSMEGEQVYIWWYDKALWDGTWRGRWLGYFARKNSVWSMKLIDSTVPDEFFEPLPVDGIKLPAVGISWRSAAAQAREQIGSSDAGMDPLWVYRLNNEDEVKRIDQLSRVHNSISRSMRFHLEKSIDAETWYPLWTAGHPGAATLITVNFGKLGTRFRYDQWGMPALIITPGMECSGTDYELDINIDKVRRKVSLSCNGVVVEGSIPMREHYLDQNDTLGVNEVTSTLEGKYPLASTFPATIIH